MPRSGQEKPLWRAHMSRRKTDLNLFRAVRGTKLYEAFVLCTLNKHQPQQDQQREARHAEDGDDESVEKIQPQRKLGEHAERA